MIFVSRTLFRVSALLAAAVLTGAFFVAVPSDAIAEQPMLVVVNAAEQGSEATFTEAQLLALPQVTIRTTTEFTDGVVEFVGPLARDAIAAVSIGQATEVHLVAANDYVKDIPVSDLTDYDVILAMWANGVRLSRRDKGPIWLMYRNHPG